MIRKTCRRLEASSRARAPFIPGMTHVRPNGSSVHYSGTLPDVGCSALPGPCRTMQVYDIDNLFVVDGAVMPFLPAKNLTFRSWATRLGSRQRHFRCELLPSEKRAGVARPAGS